MGAKEYVPARFCEVEKSLTDRLLARGQIAGAIDAVRSVMLTCRRLVPAATRALYFSPEFDNIHFSRAYDPALMYKAWLFRKNLLDKPEVAETVRNLSNLPRWVAALPKPGRTKRAASAIARSVVQDEYQRQVLQLATAATSVGVVLTDPEDASKVGTILATRRLSNVRVAYMSKMSAPIPALAAFLEGFRSGGESGTPEFPALRISLSYDERLRDTSYIDEAQNLHYEVADLEIAMECVDLDKAACFLPSDVAKLKKLRYRVLYERERLDFDTTILEQRVEHNTITDFAIDCDQSLEDYRVFQEDYSDPSWYDVETITYPDALFQLFPSLENLLLSHGGEMTIKKLELLADTSPALQVLHLPFTFWNVDAGDLVETKRGGLCLFETQLLATLDRLEQLRRVDLGILPFSTNRPAKAFRRWAKGRRVRLSVSWCMGPRDYDYTQCRSYDNDPRSGEPTPDESSSDDYGSDDLGSEEAQKTPSESALSP